MPETITFKITIEAGDGDLASRIERLGFELKEESYEDSLSREITIKENTLELTLPKTDFIDEQEQLEHILGNLGLDPDNAKAI